MHSAGVWEAVTALVMVTAIGLGLVWIGGGYRRDVRRTRSFIAAAAHIDKLDYTGNYLAGRCFAQVSFRDADGIDRAARLRLAPYLWSRLREGGTLRILYAPDDPRRIGLGGRGVRNIAGIVFIAIGCSLALLGLWLLIGGTMGWVEVDAFHPHRGWLTPLPAPTPAGR